MRLETHDLSCGYEGTPLLRNVCLAVGPGEFVCLLGPNGVGKSTLFKTILGLLPPLRGSVRVGGANLHDLPLRVRARMISYVPQSTTMLFSYTAADVVMMGRSPWMRFHEAPGARDRAVVNESFERLCIEHLKGRVFSTLSGGEKQIVLIARAMAQAARFLVLDEPTSNLDFGSQFSVLREIQHLTKHGMGIIMTTHQPNHVFQVGGRVVLIEKNGHLHAGDVRCVMTEDNLRAAYGVRVAIGHYARNDGRATSYCIPLATSAEDR